MLVLSRKRDEKIIIGDNIVVMVVRIDRDEIRLGIEAPKDISIHREEIYHANLRRLALDETTVEPQSDASI